MTDPLKIDTERLRLNRDGYLEPWPDGMLCYYAHFRTVTNELVADRDRLIAEAVRAERDACRKIVADMAFAFDKAGDKSRATALAIANNAINARNRDERGA